MILHPIAASDWPGLSSREEAIWKGQDEVGCSRPIFRNPAEGAPKRGPAWNDPAFGEEMRQLHLRCGAGIASLDSLELILNGAAEVVVTGQQPSVLGGPLYSAAKIAQALAVARARTAAGRPTVALFWSAADDSDFEEMRRSWLFGSMGPVLSLAEPGHWVPGVSVGGLPAASAINPGSSLWRNLGGNSSTVDQALELALSQADWGEATLSLLLTLFGEDGLVVLDARSPRLRELGRELFSRYARRAAEIGRAVNERGAALAVPGSAPPIASASAASGLYEIRGGSRLKVSPSGLADGLRGDIHSPGVLLRAVWQDHLLAPVGAVLGPGELAYHRQLPPVYEALGVEAAAPIPRFRLGLWPGNPPFDGDLAILEGGVAARSALGARLRGASLEESLGTAQLKIREATEELRAGMAGSSRRVDAFSRRLERELRRMESHLDRDAIAAAGESPWADYLHWHGVPQERRLSLVEGWRLAGEDFTVALRMAADAAVQSLAECSGPAGWILEGSQK